MLKSLFPIQALFGKMLGANHFLAILRNGVLDKPEIISSLNAKV